MDTINSYGGKPRVRRKANTPRRETAQSQKRSITIPLEEVSFYTDLAINILKDVAAHHLAYLPSGDKARLQKEYERDAAEIRHRVRCEGLSFFTKTLPSYAKAVDTALAEDTKTVNVTGFEINPVTGLPRFLGGLLGLIFNAKCIERDSLFDRTDVIDACVEYAETHIGSHTARVWDSGCCLEIGQHPPALLHTSTTVYSLSDFGRAVWTSRQDASREITLVAKFPVTTNPGDSARALKLLRQLCYSFYKLETPLDEKVQAEVLKGFTEVDQALPTSFEACTPTTSHVIRMARGLISRVLAAADPSDIICRHGPGAVATGEKPHQKPDFKRFYTRLNQFYSYDKYFFYNLSHLSDRLQELQSFEELEAGTAKVVLVPKDSRGPRLISCEPLEYQWVQQGQMKLLVETIECHPFTKGRVNFRDQGVNQRLAAASSKPSGYHELVTLDMKEASDRVSLALVKALFPTNWYEALFASRSSGTKLPDGTIVHLKKFAPMGSAVCFPVEALIFWALGVAVAATNVDARSLAEQLRRKWEYHDRLICKVQDFYVYGDDIICQREIVPLLRAVFGELGLRLNDSKCCVQGLFRESCGVDAFAGIDVTPTKFRRRWSSRFTPESFLSWVAYSNLLYEKGFYRAAYFVERRIQSLRRVPYVNIGAAKQSSEYKASLQGEESFVAFRRHYTQRKLKELNAGFLRRYNEEYQRVEINALTAVSQKVTGSVRGWEEMLYMSSFQPGAKSDPEIDNLSDPNILYVDAGVYSVRRRVKLKRRWMPVS